jgi:hypothetical protein
MDITQIEKKEKRRRREKHTYSCIREMEAACTSRYSPFVGTVVASNWRRMARREEGPKILYSL